MKPKKVMTGVCTSYKSLGPDLYENAIRDVMEVNIFLTLGGCVRLNQCEPFFFVADNGSN